MIDDVANAVMNGDLYDIEELLQKYLDGGSSPAECLEAMVEGLDETGKRFERGEFFLPELMVAGDAFKAGMEVLTPRLAGGSRQYKGKVILGTVQGDVHDIGKNLVGFMLESAGYQVFDLGIDVPIERFIEEVKKQNADVLALSALLTTTMLGMKNVIDELQKEGIRDQVKVIVGGAPLSIQYARDIQADAYGSTAPQAVEIVKGWLG